MSLSNTLFLRVVIENFYTKTPIVDDGRGGNGMMRNDYAFGLCSAVYSFKYSSISRM